MSTGIAKLAQDRIQRGVDLHTQIQGHSTALSTLTPEARTLRHTANAMWQAIEVQYSTQTESDLVTVAWMHMTLPRHEWRRRLSRLDREAAALERQGVEVQSQHDALKQQLTALQRNTVAQLRQLYAAHSELPATTVEYLTQVHAQHFAAAISDWDGAIAANSAAQKLVPGIELQGQGILFQAFREARTIAAHKGNLDTTLALVESLLVQRTDATLSPIQVTTLLQAQHLHAALFAAKAPLIQSTQGSAAFDTQFQKLKHDIAQFEKRVASPEYRDAHAGTRLQLVRVLWAAHRYQEAFLEAARIQRAYAGTPAVKELEAPHCWLYRARPDAYAPGGLIREDLSEISFSGLGAAYREAWAHTHENSSLVQYGLPTLGCVAGAVVASKFGAAAGTAVGPEGTALGFGAGAATGCGIGAVAGKVVDWSASAISAPAVAQSLLTGVSDETLGMTWVHMNVAALDLATTYYLGKTLWSPALGFAQGGADIASAAARIGKYAITQPGAALADMGTGALTTARVSVAVAETLAQPILHPMAAVRSGMTAVRANAIQMADTFRHLTMDAYTHAASVAMRMGVSAALLYPAISEAKALSVDDKDLHPLLRSLMRPAWWEWAVCIPSVLIGTWLSARSFYLDKLIKTPRMMSALGEARALQWHKIIEGSPIGLWDSAVAVTLTNAPWVYMQMRDDHVTPLVYPIGCISDVLFVVGSNLAKQIVEKSGRGALTRPLQSGWANWLREKTSNGILGFTSLKIDPKVIVPRNYMPFFAWNLLFSQVNNQTLGLLSVDAVPGPWILRNVAQPVPMFFRKALWAVPMGIKNPIAQTGDWFLNTYENLMLSWFFPPWAGKESWLQNFKIQDEKSSWDDFLVNHLDKTRRGVIHFPFTPDYKLLVVETENYFREMTRGNLGDPKVLDRLAALTFENARLENVLTLPPVQRRYVLINLALIAKAARTPDATIPDDKRAQLKRLAPLAQQALTHYLKLMEFRSMDALMHAPVEEIVEHINAIR